MDVGGDSGGGGVGVGNGVGCGNSGTLDGDDNDQSIGSDRIELAKGHLECLLRLLRHYRYISSFAYKNIANSQPPKTRIALQNDLLFCGEMYRSVLDALPIVDMSSRQVDVEGSYKEIERDRFIDIFGWSGTMRKGKRSIMRKAQKTNIAIEAVQQQQQQHHQPQPDQQQLNANSTITKHEMISQTITHQHQAQVVQILQQTESGEPVVAVLDGPPVLQAIQYIDQATNVQQTILIDQNGQQYQYQPASSTLVPTSIELTFERPATSSPSTSKLATEKPTTTLPKKMPETPRPCKYYCTFQNCRFKTNDLETLQGHEERYHTGPNQFYCPHDCCYESFATQQELDVHCLGAHATPFKSFRDTFNCGACFITFKNRSQMLKHFRDIHARIEENGSRITCKLCYPCRPYRLVSSFYRHMREDHSDKVMDQIQNSEVTSVPVHRCTVDDCGREFMTSLKLRDHIKMDHPDAYITCKYCNRKCKSRTNLLTHINYMHRTGEYPCTHDGCTFVGNTNRELKLHNQRDHGELRKCKVCSEMLSRSAISGHMANVHSLKPHACTWPGCGKSYPTSYRLKSHFRSHVKYKRFRCKWPKCTFASEQKATVSTHVKNRHFKIPLCEEMRQQLGVQSFDPAQQNPYDFVETLAEDIVI